MEVISLLAPHFGGMWEFFNNLRCGLLRYGVRMRWLVVKYADHGQLSGATSAEQCAGQIIVSPTNTAADCAAAYLEHLTGHRPSLVIHHVLGSTIEINLARYLPPEIRRILVVHNITPATYRAARAVRDYVHATVGVSRRVREDLVRYCGFDPDWTVAIANGVQLARFDNLPPAPVCPPARLLFLGRIEDISKGVLWLPNILERVLAAGVDATLTVAGDGPDLAPLRQRFGNRGLAARVRLTGPCKPEEVPNIMAQHHVFIFPSRFEGIGLALIEALAAGCAPVASRIEGVTDTVVQHGRNGFLFPPGDIQAAADCVVRLARNAHLRSVFGDAARTSARERFGVERMASQYYELIRRVIQEPRPIFPPLPIEHWGVPKGLRPAWWHHLPQPVKNRFRTLRFRLPSAFIRVFGTF